MPIQIAQLADPTRTKTLRSKYATALTKRLRDLKGDIRETIVENDALRLDSFPSSLAAADDFGFSQNPDKEAAFQRWLAEQIRKNVLEPVGSERLKRGGHYSSKYVRRAAQRGVRHANSELRRQGVDVEDDVQATLRAPIHQNLLSSLYRRNFRELEGITDEMDRQISRELADGLSQGHNPRRMARNITDRVDKIGITRSTTMARTEVVRTFNEHALTRYEEHGADQVVGKAEFSTAGDRRVCAICRALEGTTYEIDEARGLIPVHPNCRCTFLPVLNTES